MATISNPTDPNKTVATSNVAPQPVSTSGTQTPTGQYSTLQKYLSANQGSGQRLAGAIGSNVNKEITGLKDTTGREINEAGAANKNIGDLTGTTSKYTEDLKSANVVPGTVQPSNSNLQGVAVSDKFDLSNRPAKPTTKAYDVNSYATNLSGANAAADIAKDQTKLNTFRGIATGDTSSQLQKESNKQANEALNASAKAYDTNKERQSQLNNFGDRSMLLQKAINSRNQRAGLQNLDNALLSQDKSGTLNQVNQNLQANTKGLQENKNVATAKQEEVGTLSTAQAAAELGLNNRLGEMTAEQQNALTARVGQINKAKADTKARMEADYKKFQDTGEISQALYDTLQLGNVQDVDAAAGISGGNPVSQKMTNPNETQQQKNVRLFNVLKDKGLGSFLDTGLLDTQAMTGQDVVNQQDMDNLNSLAALTGGTNSAKLSQFGNKQIGESSLDEDLNARAQKFLDQDLQQRYSASGSDTQSMGGGKKGYGASSATATLNEYLYGQGIARQSKNSVGGGTMSFLDSIINAPANIMTGNIPAVTNNLSTIFEGATDMLENPLLSSIGVGGIGPALSVENANANRVANDLAVRNAGYTYAGGRNANNYGEMDNWAAQTQAEQQAVGGVNKQIQDQLGSIGYQNLLKLIQGEGGEY